MTLVLHSFFRSTASWRVRIALGLKGLPYATVSHHLRLNEHREGEYLAINPQGLVPTLEVDGAMLTQSLAICEYLDETHPAPPLLPSTPVERARVRAFAQVIACDIHPVQNLKILNRLRALDLADPVINGWAAATIEEGFDACVELIEAGPGGPYCFGDQPTLADLCLIPQMSNARRFGVNMRWPRLLEIATNCNALPAFVQAAPENQPDAE